MQLGVFQHGWWDVAAKAAGHDVVPLPVTSHPSGNAYASTLAQRLEHAPAILSGLKARRPACLIDNGGTGLGFLGDQGATSTHVQLLHESVGLPLCSHFIDPLVTAMQGLDFSTLWQALQSRTWIKAVWDRAHTRELALLGVPSVLHLPMAAPNRDYDTSPPDLRRVRPVVSFVGGQNSTYFRNGAATPTASLLAGVLAHCRRAENPDAAFYDVYQDMYGPSLSQPVDILEQSRKAFEYFQCKLFWHATLCIRNRDRFVLFLKKQLGRQFEIRGNGWKEAYGLDCQPQIPTAEEYFRHFRETAINVNLVNGNAETGLNMRHFEITAAGGFMLCYAQPELAECFGVGKECGVFTSEADLLAKIRYYMDRPEERARIALAGQKRTLSRHLYSHRLQTLLDSCMKQTAGPMQERKSDGSDSKSGDRLAQPALHPPCLSGQEG